MNENVQDIFKGLSDDIIKIYVGYNYAGFINGGGWQVYEINGEHDSVFKIDILELPIGTYYREGYEPKKILLTADDLDKRTDLRIKNDILRETILDYTFMCVFTRDDEYTYKELSENFTWLNGDKCYKGGE